MCQGLAHGRDLTNIVSFIPSCHFLPQSSSMSDCPNTSQALFGGFLTLTKLLGYPWLFCPPEALGVGGGTQASEFSKVAPNDSAV